MSNETERELDYFNCVFDPKRQPLVDAYFNEMTRWNRKDMFRGKVGKVFRFILKGIEYIIVCIIMTIACYAFIGMC